MPSRIRLFCAAILLLSASARAELPPVFGENPPQPDKDACVRVYLPPTAIAWKSDESGKAIANWEVLLKPGVGQANYTSSRDFCHLKNTPGKKASLLLDFGKELHGGIQIVTGPNKGKIPTRVRIRLGESVSEAMSELGGKQGATNDHANRDFETLIPWFGILNVGDSGFRFARIDLLGEQSEALIKEIRAIFIYRDLPYLGSFRCNDERLNRIWMTGAYTTHLNMQNYLWDGIKRDRLVWIGDTHPELMTINAVFGYNEVVPRSLDLVRDLTPLPTYMNGISSYSMWWVLDHYNWYQQHGDLEYLKRQRTYLVGLLKHLIGKIGEDNQEKLDGMRFLDWPTSENKPAIHAGLQALMVMTMESGAELCRAIGEGDVAGQCAAAAGRLRKSVPDPNGSKQAAALLALAGLAPAEQINREELAKDGSRGISPFYGYYVLEARAKAGDHQGAIDCIREYWGAMLDLGATTFWEHFDIADKDGARIDQIVPPGKRDVHADGGAYCYVGLRQSLCHGWASGPTPWLTAHVLGIQVLEPGCRKIKIEPHLGDLKWVEGSYPTPKGVVKVRHEKQADGTVKTTFSAPEGIEVVK